MISKLDRAARLVGKPFPGTMAAGIALCFLAPFCTGCATTPGVVRGQSPAQAQQASMMTAMSNGAAMPAGDGCPDGCDDGYCCLCHCHCNLPQHRLYYHYAQPGRCCLGSCLNIPPCPYSAQAGPLVYPQNPSPAALVQYPYYVCKGPDDFYYQK